MATLDSDDKTPPTWQQPGSLPATTLDDLAGILRADGEAPWGLFLQQEAFVTRARRCEGVIEKGSITGRRYRGGTEHEVIEDCERQRVIKTPDGRLCPIDIVPCVADAQMTTFMKARVKTWAARH